MISDLLNYDFTPLNAGSLPLFGQLMTKLSLPDILNSNIRMSHTNSDNLDHGTMLCAMIHNLLDEPTIRLYKLSQFFEDKALPLLFPWNPHVQHSAFTEDRAGAALDALFKAGPQSVLSKVTEQLVDTFELQTEIIRYDTTNRQFTGMYEVDEQQTNQPAVLITHGYSKKARRDLKQIIFGVTSTQDGIPLTAQIADGNATDPKLNHQWINQVRNWLQKHGDEFLIYIADSALINDGNLIKLEQQQIDFISRMPHRYKLPDALIDAAIISDTPWTDIGRYSANKDAASYKLKEFQRKIGTEAPDRDYRFIVVHSDHLDKRRVKKLDREIKRIRNDLAKLVAELVKTEYACLADAKTSLGQIVADHSSTLYQIRGTVRVEDREIKKRGRKPIDYRPEMETIYKLDLELVRNEELYQEKLQRCGMFVLITSLLDTEQYPAETILRLYKDQYTIEHVFKFVKDPTVVGSFCLKTESRIVALGYLIILAAQLSTIVEREVRKNLQVSEIKSIEAIGKKRTARPTTYIIKTVLRTILVLKIRDRKTDEVIWQLGQPLKDNQRQILELVGLDESIYEFSV